MNYDIEDDLGVPYGDAQLPCAAEARHEVRQWQIAAVGHRPKDYMARDLLFGSLGRDRRMWLYRQLLRNRPSWTTHDTLEFADPDRKAIVQHRVFHLLHQMHWLRLRDEADEQAEQILRKLSRCWPYSVQVRWKGPGERSPRDVCGLARHCPFCFARSVIDLHDRIQRGPWESPQNKFLVLGRLSIPDVLFEREDHDFDLARRIRYARGPVSEFLRAQARAMGVDGGIVAFSMGPRLSRIPTNAAGEWTYAASPGFSYELSLLGEVSQGVQRLVRARRYPESLLEEAPPPNLGGELLMPRWTIRSGGDRQALRLMLAGSSYGYRGSSMPPEGRGLFFWPSWSLSDYHQWRSHMDETWNRRLFSSWGTWAGALPATNHRRPALVNRRSRQGLVRKQQALERVNASKRDAANQRRTELIESAEPVWSTLIATNGQSPGRVELARALKEQNIPVSERDTRWLIRQLRNGCNGQAR